MMQPYEKTENGLESVKLIGYRWHRFSDFAIDYISNDELSGKWNICNKQLYNSDGRALSPIEVQEIYDDADLIKQTEKLRCFKWRFMAKEYANYLVNHPRSNETVRRLVKMNLALYSSCQQQ
jgi:hypothetical protein